MAEPKAGPVPANPSIAHIATDPLRNFKFMVTIGGPYYTSGVNMGFMSVSGLSITTEIIPYREGGMNTTTQKMPGQSDFAPLTLSKGVAVGGVGNANMEWMKELFTVMQGSGNSLGRRTSSDNERIAVQDFRQMVQIKVLDHPVTKGPSPVKALFKVYNAWPTSIAFSDFDAGANALMIQQMTLAHEGFDFTLFKKQGYGGSL